MGKKRKSDATRLDEADRHLYAHFRSAANSLSLLYSQTVNQQHLSFQSGQYHALEKLYQWIVTQREERIQVTTDHIVAHLQTEIEYDTTDDAATLFPTSLDNGNSQTISHSSGSGFDAPVSSSIPSSLNVEFDHQAKLLNFPDALTTQVPENLHHCQFTDNSSHHNLLHPTISMQSSNEACDQGQRQSSIDPHHTSDDCSDMQTDDPTQKSVYRFFNHK